MQIDAVWSLGKRTEKTGNTQGELLRVLLTLKLWPLIQEYFAFQVEPFKVLAHAVLLKPQHDAAYSRQRQRERERNQFRDAIIKNKNYDQYLDISIKMLPNKQSNS